MGLRLRVLASGFVLSTAIASGQPAAPASDSAPIIQPGAPGETSKKITAAEAAPRVRPPSAVDISFMQGMIMHHSQAVTMTDLLLTRTHSKDLLELGKRISISQTDEMKYMKQWLTDRGQPESMEQGQMHHMDGMKSSADKSMAHMNMGAMPLMPGMLTPQQMMALEQARGAAFDHLFLTGMIQHHTGALTMVQDLFNTPGAGQDAMLFDFATDVDNTQRAEISIMRSLLLKEKK
jgi:uncharacterized protein (DUF305 family)